MNQDNFNCQEWNASDIHLQCPVATSQLLRTLGDINGFANSSCFFERQLEKSFNIIYLNDSLKAKSLAEEATVYGWIHIPPNFAHQASQRKNKHFFFPSKMFLLLFILIGNTEEITNVNCRFNSENSFRQEQ